MHNHVDANAPHRRSATYRNATPRHEKRTLLLIRFSSFSHPRYPPTSGGDDVFDGCGSKINASARYKGRSPPNYTRFHFNLIYSLSSLLLRSPSLFGISLLYLFTCQRFVTLASRHVLNLIEKDLLIHPDPERWPVDVPDGVNQPDRYCLKPSSRIAKR